MVELEHILVRDPGPGGKQPAALIEIGVIGLRDFAHRVDEADVLFLADGIRRERHRRRCQQERGGEQWRLLSVQVNQLSFGHLCLPVHVLAISRDVNVCVNTHKL